MIGLVFFYNNYCEFAYCKCIFLDILLFTKAIV